MFGLESADTSHTPMEPTHADAATILVVEDDGDLAELIQMTLAPIGTAQTVTSAERALELLGSRDWNLIITDIGLPGMDGLEFLQIVQDRAPSAARLVVSGQERFELAVDAIRAGAVDYITKPFKPAELREKAQAAIGAQRARLPRDKEVVLAIGAHPDDVEIGCGGILLRHRAMGHRVVITTLTSGERGGEQAVRGLEAQAAAEKMGASLHLLGLDDTTLSDGGDTIRPLSKVVEEVHPTTVYTHTNRDVHQDHRSTHQATMVATRGVPKVYAYQSPSSTVDFRPTRFISIDDFLAEKLATIRVYHSQTNTRSYLDEELLSATARYWGRFSRSRYVEPLEVLRDADPVTGSMASPTGDATSPAAEMAEDRETEAQAAEIGASVNVG